jgi:hypothetical protein
MAKSRMTELVTFGWSDDFAKHFVETGDFMPARVVAQHRTGYRIQTDTAELPARTAGRLRYQAPSPAELPAVGDWVVAQAQFDEKQRIKSIMRSLRHHSRYRT